MALALCTAEEVRTELEARNVVATEFGHEPLVGMIQAAAKKADGKPLAVPEQEWYGLYVMWAARSYCEHFALDMADTDPVLLGPADQAELAQWVDVAYVHLAEVELHRAGWIDSAAVDRPFMMEDISPKAVLEAPDGERPAGVTATARALYEDLLGFDGDLDEQPARRYKASAVFTHEPRAGFCARHRH